MPFVHLHDVTLQQDNTRPHFARICTQFLETEHVPFHPWPAYSPDMSPIEHIWDPLARQVWQRVVISGNVHELRIALQEEWDNIPQAKIGKLVGSMRRRCCKMFEICYIMIHMCIYIWSAFYLTISLLFNIQLDSQTGLLRNFIEDEQPFIFVGNKYDEEQKILFEYCER